MDGVPVHGSVRPWAFFRALAHADGAVGCTRLRRYRLRRYECVRSLIQAGVLFWGARTRVALLGLRQPIPAAPKRQPVGLRPPRGPGSARFRIQSPSAVVPTNLPVFQPAITRELYRPCATRDSG